MSFGGFLKNNWGGGGAGGGARIVADIIPYSNGTTNDNRMPSSGSISHQPRLVTTAPTTTMAKSMFNSPGLSRAHSYEPGLRRSREEEHESISGSDNMEGPTSGDDQDAADKPPGKTLSPTYPKANSRAQAYDMISPHILISLSLYCVFLQFCLFDLCMILMRERSMCVLDA
ncbi:hypothetical protein K1719_031366 [Acacia pycnantha]|nr:hypothetical protein K1719_031366 [Acacia pycnantha]